MLKNMFINRMSEEIYIDVSGTKTDKMLYKKGVII